MGHWGSTFSGDLKVPGYGTDRHGTRRHGTRRHGTRRCGTRRCGTCHDGTGRDGTGGASIVVVDLQVHEGVSAPMDIDAMVNVLPRCPITNIHCQI